MDGSDWDPDDLRNLRGFFVDEAREHLLAMEESLKRLHRDPTATRVELGAILRHLHTAKGSAGSVKLDQLAQLTHELEEKVVALVRSGENLALAELGSLESSLDEWATLLGEEERALRAPDPLPDAPLHDRRLVDRRLDVDTLAVRVEVERIEELMDVAAELVFDRTRIVRRLQDLKGAIEALAEIQPALERLTQTARPDEQAALTQLTARLGDELGSLRRFAQATADDAESLAHTSSTLQEGIRRVRTMAVGRLMARLEQPVRELARKEHKRVRLVTLGEETEIDKGVAERILEPLVHLLRNAVAHGIEPPEVRRALGKSEEGTITFSAHQENEEVVLTIADDGQGISLGAVRDALLASGRDPGEISRLDASALYAALFEPGLSTRMGTDDLAGRGIGLDAVRETVSRLGGRVEVSSTPGEGALFTLRLPITKPVKEALLFKVGGQVYGVPSARVEEILEITTGDLRLAVDGDYLTLPTSVSPFELPVVRLGALFGVPPPPGQNRRNAVVLRAKDTRFAITCDKVVGPREVVVRPLGPLFDRLPLFSGATISGAGKVQLLLNVEALCDQSHKGVPSQRPARASGPPRILLVDDSRAVRELVSLLLTDGGYLVELAQDGWEAWMLLQDRPFDFLLTDLEMPRLDGHELIERVRRTPELAELPILVVSSRSGDSVRAQVLAAGAAAFVSKPIDRAALLAAIGTLVEPK